MMSIATTIPSLPDGNSAARASAKKTIWRLGAVAFGHPVEPLQVAIASGSFHEAFDAAWSIVTGRHWPQSPPSPDFESLEAGYIAAFSHGRNGKPVAPLLAGDYETLLAGQSRPTFMLNISSFFRHFGLCAAVEDEGRADEPDHLACMLEFMAVLAYLEARAVATHRDKDGYRRAQRDFLRRYIEPLLEQIGDRLRQAPQLELDATLARLLEDLRNFAMNQIIELEAQVGAYRDPDSPSVSSDTLSVGVVNQDRVFRESSG
jgi:DMSO reductase family type II enzyme chaperone